MTTPAILDQFDARIEDTRGGMIDLLTKWASINSGSYNEAGLLEMLAALEAAFSELPVVIERVPCPGVGSDAAGQFTRYALRVKPRKPIEGVKPIFLNGHYDTVYGAEHDFNSVTRVDDHHLRGPGVTDMKGGLVVLLTALKLWESSEYTGCLPWELLITPDEEIGSEASDPLLRDAAGRCQYGLVYESAYMDGGFVRSRMGSAVYTLRSHGRPAHVGRNFEEGCNAILALAQLCQLVKSLADDLGLIANVGRFEADSPLNVVPDAAECAWNVRSASPQAFRVFEEALDGIIRKEKYGFAEGVEFEWSGGLVRPPKIVDERTKFLYDGVEKVARRIGLPVLWRDTGGGSDGSNLAAYGLPTIDNLGVRGGNIHTKEEFVALDSLNERVALTLGIFVSILKGSFTEELSMHRSQ